MINDGVARRLAYIAVLLATTLLGAASATWADEKKPTVSSAMQKPLSEIQELLKASKFPEAIEKLGAADAMKDKSPFDQHVINQDLLFACSKTNDVPCMSKALAALVDDSLTPAEDVQNYTRYLVQTNYKEQHYDKVVEYGTRAIKGGFAVDETYLLVESAYYLREHYADAAKFSEPHIADVVKAGQTPKSDELNIFLSSCAKLKDDACVMRALQYQVTYYPKPETWYNLLALVRQQASNDIETLQTYRLMFAVGALQTADEYLEMAQTAMRVGSPGEARSVVQAGLDKHIFTDSRLQRAQRLLADAKQAGTTDEASLAKAAPEADAAPTGVKNAGVGLAYLGYQQYDKAVEQLSKAVNKGGLKNEADSRLLLGIAQLKAGHKDDAVKTFATVKGAPVLERLAALWAIYARQA